MNARNVIWSLMLNRPYMNGGSPTNTHWPIPTAVFIDGRLNDPHVSDHYWSVEIALPLKYYVTNDTVAKAPPNVGDIWRINFSRVEWHGSWHG